MRLRAAQRRPLATKQLLAWAFLRRDRAQGRGRIHDLDPAVHEVVRVEVGRSGDLDAHSDVPGPRARHDSSRGRDRHFGLRDVDDRVVEVTPEDVEGLHTRLGGLVAHADVDEVVRGGVLTERGLGRSSDRLIRCRGDRCGRSGKHEHGRVAADRATDVPKKGLRCDDAGRPGRPRRPGRTRWVSPRTRPGEVDAPPQGRDGLPSLGESAPSRALLGYPDETTC